MFVGRYSAIVWLYIVILVVGLVCFLCVLNHIICDSAFIEIDELIKWLTTHNPIGHFQAFSHFHEISHCFSLVSILTHASIKYVTIVNLFEHFIIQGNTQITSHFAGAFHLQNLLVMLKPIVFRNPRIIWQQRLNDISIWKRLFIIGCSSCSSSGLTICITAETLDLSIW